MRAYQLLERLGEGTFATGAYKARFRPTGELVCARRFRDHEDADGVREANMESTIATNPELRALQALRQAGPAAGVTHLRDLVFRRAGVLFAVTDYYQRSVRSVLQQQRRRAATSTTTTGEDGSNAGDRERDIRRVRRWVRQLLGALGHVHAAGLVHCDVRPEKLFLSNSGDGGGGGDVKLGGFGRSAAIGDPIPALAAPRGIAEAPELVRAAASTATPASAVYRADPAVDLWSVGCVLLELCGTLLAEPRPPTEADEGEVTHTAGPPDGPLAVARGLLDSEPEQRVEVLGRHRWLHNDDDDDGD